MLISVSLALSIIIVCASARVEVFKEYTDITFGRYW